MACKEVFIGYLRSSTSLGISDFEISTFAFEHDPGGAIYPNSKGAETGMLTGIAGKQKLMSSSFSFRSKLPASPD